MKTVYILQKKIESRFRKQKRRRLIKRAHKLDIRFPENAPSAAELIREDRNR